MMSSIAVLALAATGLVACGETDEAFRSNYRTSAIAECTRGAQSAPSVPGINPEQLCTCMVEGYMRDTPSDRLKAERGQTQAPPAAQSAMMECVRQATSGQSGAAPATPAGNTQ